MHASFYMSPSAQGGLRAGLQNLNPSIVSYLRACLTTSVTGEAS